MSVVEARSTTSTRRLYAFYPPWESLASASPRPNFPVEDKPHNLRVDVVDPILLSLGHFHSLKHTLISVLWCCWARNCSHR